MENPFAFLLLARRRLSSVAERTKTTPLLQKFSFQQKSNSRVTALKGQAEITTPLYSRSASLILQVPESALRNLHCWLWTSLHPSCACSHLGLQATGIVLHYSVQHRTGFTPRTCQRHPLTQQRPGIPTPLPNLLARSTRLSPLL